MSVKTNTHETVASPFTVTFWAGNREVTGNVTEVDYDASGAAFYTVVTPHGVHTFVPAIMAH